MSRILVVEDDSTLRKALSKLLVRHGHEVAMAGSVAEAVEGHHLDGFDLIITDLRLPDGAGTDLIAPAGETRVLVITGFADVKSAVDAMKRGAADYIAKSPDLHELLLIVTRELNSRQLHLRAAALAKDVAEAWPVKGIIGASPAMQAVFKLIKRFAPTEATVVVRGESGTGKELVARAIHDHSRRRDGPLVALNCAAIAEGLLDSELFGYEPGAFSGAVKAHAGLIEEANGGTLFLDEIGELPMKAQASLLRVLEQRKVRRVGATKERPVDVRLLAATHRDLKQLVKNGCFRQDFHARLGRCEIMLPPLRERGDDIKALARYLLAQAGRHLAKSDLELTPEALAAIHAYHWPANVRELANAIERGAILCDTGRITPELLGIEEPDELADADSLIDAFVSKFILKNQACLSETEIAHRLGRTRKWLWETRKRLGIPRPPRDPARYRK